MSSEPNNSQVCSPYTNDTTLRKDLIKNLPNELIQSLNLSHRNFTATDEKIRSWIIPKEKGVIKKRKKGWFNVIVSDIRYYLGSNKRFFSNLFHVIIIYGNFCMAMCNGKHRFAGDGIYEFAWRSAMKMSDAECGFFSYWHLMKDCQWILLCKGRLFYRSNSISMWSER